MKILITGSGGYLGSRVAAALAPDHEVISIVRPGARTGTEPGRVVEHDLTRPFADGELPESVDAVLHLAQSRHYRAFPERADDIFAVNVASTLHLLQYARRAGARRFVLASSGGISGNKQEPIRESDPPNPPGFYLTSKLQAELLVQSFSDYFATTILRYFFIYGPHQTGRMVPMFLERLQQGEPIRLEGDEGMRLNPIFVDDAVAATTAALQLHGHHVINVAGPEPTSIRALVETLADLTGRRPHWQAAGMPPLGHMVADIETMRLLLGAPQVGLSEGLRRTVAATAPTA